MTPEGRIVAAVKRELDKRGIFHINLNGGNGQTGLPDRLAFPGPGRLLPIECKAPGIGRVTPKQAWVHEQFVVAGWPVLVVDDVAQLREWLDARNATMPPGENQILRAALIRTIDLCNAMREYAPTLNMDAERTLRDALRAAA